LSFGGGTTDCKVRNDTPAGFEINCGAGAWTKASFSKSCAELSYSGLVFTKKK